MDKSAYPASSFAHNFPLKVNLFYQPPIVNPIFLIHKMSDHHDFSPAKHAIFDHMKLLYKKLSPNLFEWGKQFSKLWVGLLYIVWHILLIFGCTGVRKNPVSQSTILPLTTIISIGLWMNTVNSKMCGTLLFWPGVVNSSPQNFMRRPRRKLPKLKVHP